MSAKLKTDNQLKTEAMHKKVINEYLSVKKEHPEVSAWRCMVYVADRQGITGQGVRQILTRHGIYKTKSKQPTMEI